MARVKSITVDTPFGPVTAVPHRARALAKYYENPNRCKTCGKIIEIDLSKKIVESSSKQFCNHSCAAQFTNKSRTLKDPDEFKCKACGKQIHGNKTYCSRACYYKLRDQEIENDLNACSDRVLKSYLIRHRGYACEQCGLTTWRNQPAPIEIHHKNGDSNDNRLDNLQLLCSNCHDLEPTSKGKNRGRGRRDRYRSSGAPCEA